ncbi:response regulator [Glaciibacter sp. 2TAF33]|uniref:response regulator n=1 Tax=Glaciibacter sp. 2TAF33 TaxID=3233015 RepID=UPI003F8FE59B
MTAIRIMLVDDQALLRVGFRMLLDAEDDLDVVAEAGDGAEAVAMAERVRPDVILMDVRMPGVDGIEATRRITGARPECKVIILTTFDLDEYAFGGLRAGASGFLVKDSKPAELTAAIRAVASGEASVSPRVTRRMLDLFGSRLPQAPPEAGTDRLAVLTEREREVFLGIARGLSNGELTQTLFLSESTVKTHIGRILAKLELRDRVQIVILAYELGLAGG